MSSPTVVIQTYDGKILDIFSNVSTTVMILDDYLEERRNAPIIELDNGLKTYIFNKKVGHKATNIKQKSVINGVQKLYGGISPYMDSKEPKHGIVVVETCGGYVKNVIGNTTAKLIILDEKVDNKRKIGTVAFKNGVKSYIWFGIVSRYKLTDEQKDLLSALVKHVKNKSHEDKLIGEVLFEGEVFPNLEFPNIMKACRAERAYRAIMRSDFAFTLLDEFINGPGDLICDIMHLCDLCDLPFEDVMDRAMMHYDEEKAEEGQYETQRDLPIHD